MNNHNIHYDDPYFSRDCGLKESHYVFIEGNDICEKWIHSPNLSIGELGYGTGLNFFLLLDLASREAPELKKSLSYYTCEKYPLSPDQCFELLVPYKGHMDLSNLMTAYKQLYSSLKPGWNELQYSYNQITCHFHFYYGDVSGMLSSGSWICDAWFLDGHDPRKNPDMWTFKVFDLIAKHSRPGSSFSSYTAAGIVKQGLRQAGFEVKRKKGFGKKRHMIYGYLNQ